MLKSILHVVSMLFVCSACLLASFFQISYAATIPDSNQIFVDIRKANEGLLRSNSVEAFDKVMECISTDWSNFQRKEASKQGRDYQSGLGATLNALKEVEEQSSIHEILAVERAILMLEDRVYVNSQEMQDSNMWAVAGIDEALVCLAQLESQDQYIISVPVFSVSDKQNGLPLDAFRKFVQSHLSRLTGLLRSVSSEAEKDIIRQRRKNISTAERVYIKHQENALKSTGLRDAN